MGIPSYFSYVLKNHFKIIKQLKQTPCNLLLIDANSFIYDVIHEGKTDIKESVYLKIMNLIVFVWNIIFPNILVIMDIITITK